jgi:L-serine dehydratase
LLHSIIFANNKIHTTDGRMYLSFDMLKLVLAFKLAHIRALRAAERFLRNCEENLFPKVERVKIDFIRFPSLTGKGHATDLAVMLG